MRAALLVAILLALPVNMAHAASYAVLHRFASLAEGVAPAAGVTQGPDGTLYGTTSAGGTLACISPDDIPGCGTVFALAPKGAGGTGWKATVLYRFTGIDDGFAPLAGLLRDQAGNLYGTTAAGGANAENSACGVDGCGTVFRLAPPESQGAAWTKTTLYSFLGGTGDGFQPTGRLIMDSDGALLGTAEIGGSANCAEGCGIVFRLTPPAGGAGGWTETVLYAFPGGAGGANPTTALLPGPSGSYYVTTQFGGADLFDCEGVGCGTVVQLLPPAAGQSAWQAQIVHSFTRATDGAYPAGDLAFDPNGDLYATTSLGGGAQFNGGTAFELQPPPAGGSAWSETILHRFGRVFKDADSPGTLIRTKAGTLLGAAGGGGRNDDGAVFALSPPKAGQSGWQDKLLHRFPDSSPGGSPNGALYQAPDGTLYGTSFGVGTLTDFGLVFSLAR